jgi:uncharacterized protein (TIGR02246 family)
MLARFRPSRATWIVFLASAFLVLFAVLAARQFRGRSGQEHPAGPKPQHQAKMVTKETAPETLARELVRAWNRGDAERIAGLFAPNGVLIIPTGSEIRSRAAIKKTISEQRAGLLKETSLTNTIDDVSLPDEDTAVVKGTYRLDGIKLLGLTKSSAGSYVLRQMKQNGQWIIAKAEVLRK